MFHTPLLFGSSEIIDTTPPTIPGGFTATEGIGEIDLSWTASTDNVAVSQYEIQRRTNSGAWGNLLPALHPTTTSTDTEVVSGNTYEYRIRAKDTSSNVSGYSTIEAVIMS